MTRFGDIVAAIFIPKLRPSFLIRFFSVHCFPNAAIMSRNEHFWERSFLKTCFTILGSNLYRPYVLKQTLHAGTHQPSLLFGSTFSANLLKLRPSPPLWVEKKSYVNRHK